MNTVKDLFEGVTKLSKEVTKPFENSKKIYVEGSNPSIKVGMREVSQSTTSTSSGEVINPPITVYDTSGPYTDPNTSIDLLRGLPKLREKWILARSDSKYLNEPTSDFGKARQKDATLTNISFKSVSYTHLTLPTNREV